MIVELSIPSEKVTDVVVVRPETADSAGENEKTDGAVVSVSTMKELIFNAAECPNASVIVIVQSE